MIDTTYSVEAPEGVDLTLRLAGPVPRAVAYLVDLTLRWVGYLAIGSVLGLLAEIGMGILILMVALGEVIYPVALELLNDGRTIGKGVVGIRVVHDDGTRVRWQASLIRNLLLAVDWLPGTYLFALASLLASPRFQRLGDHAAGTLVVYAEAKQPSTLAPANAQAPSPPAIPLSLDEQGALLAFSARGAAFSPARREELASLATPLLRPGAPASAQLDAVAGYLRGNERTR